MAYALNLQALLLVFICVGWSAQARNIDVIREQRLIGKECGGIYKKASHCWPFSTGFRSVVSKDLKGDRQASLKNGARIVKSSVRGKVASTEKGGSNSWIDLGNFTGRCIGQPQFCLNGTTMIFWAKFDQSLKYQNDKKYVFSSGGTDFKSQGFSLYKEYSEFILKVASDTQVWKAFIAGDNIPIGRWFSFAFTWSKGSGLKYYINGDLSGYQINASSYSHENNFNDFRIAKSSSDQSAYGSTLQMKFDQLATWSRILNSQEIQMAFNQGGGAQSENACELNPCQHGGTCYEESNAQGYRCECTQEYEGMKCELIKPACEPNPCLHGGQCYEEPETDDRYRCECISGYSGKQCETRKPACAANPCLHGGTCHERPGEPEGFICECPQYFFGLKCENVSKVQPQTPLPDIKQFRHHLLNEINYFRRLHQSTDVLASDKLNHLADEWAHKIASEGEAKINPDSEYGQLVCMHHPGGDMAKACTVKWYSTVSFYDWADPKLTVKSSPFTQLVWKNNALAGVGLARGNGANKRENIEGNYADDNVYNYVVVFFDPGQNAGGDVRENVLPAAGLAEPSSDAACPDGYYRLPYGSRSCFSVHDTPQSWIRAVIDCAWDGGTLASLQTREEADLVVNLLSEHDISEAWIGLHDHSSEGRYVWVDGSTIPFSEWLPGEPDGNEDENCIIQAKEQHSPGWGDRHCLDPKPFVCEVPIPGFTTYKLTFHITEELTNYQNVMHPMAAYPEYYMCTPYIQSVNDLLRERIAHFFEVRKILVVPAVNTIKCMSNGESNVEVILRLGPGVSSESIHALRNKVKENGGELELSNRATLRLTAIEIVKPGISYCPVHCAGSACHAGCDAHCCSNAAAHYPAPSAYHPVPIYPENNPWNCPVSCKSNLAYCPPYCPPICCKRRLRAKTH